MFEVGQYFSLIELAPCEARFLAERRLISPSLLNGKGPRGVYVSDDQMLSIMVNEDDHLRLTAIAPGLQLQEAWSKLDALDDALGRGLDFAYGDILGYLTSDLSRLGTGLCATVVLHLAGLADAKKVLTLEQEVRDAHGHTLDGELGSVQDGLGAFYALSNRVTLGRTEEETIYDLRSLAMNIVEQEKAAREHMLNHGARGIEDRVGRALGIARGARLLEFEGGVELLSSLRLGVATGLLTDYELGKINELLVTSQPAHIELAKGKTCDELALSMERADMFRARFS
jgi:protein arginine kinase